MSLPVPHPVEHLLVEVPGLWPDIRLAHTDMELAARQRQVAQSLFDAGEAVRASVLRAELAVVSAERNSTLRMVPSEDSSRQA